MIRAIGMQLARDLYTLQDSVTQVHLDEPKPADARRLYTIIEETLSVVQTEYIVLARSEEEAEQLFLDGKCEYVDSEIGDVRSVLETDVFLREE